LRNGLAAHNEPGADREIEALAHAIVGPERGSELLALARQVADAELGLPAGPKRANDPGKSSTAALEPRSGFVEVVNGVSPHAVIRRRSLGNDFEAGALERYELKGAPGARRKFAIRDYDAARAGLAARQQSIEDLA
jgi:hypothetical protein